MIRQMVSGRPHQMVEHTEFQWAVLIRERLIGTLRQHPSGMFHCGQLSFPRMRIEEAAVALAKRLRPAKIPDAEPGPGEGPVFRS